MIYVSVEKMMELDGWIKADGKSGDSGGGGASGGTIWVAARHFEGDKQNVIIKFCPSWCFLKDILFTFIWKLTTNHADNIFHFLLACVASVSARVRRERWDESKKKGMTGEGKGKEGTACPQTPRF